MKPGQLPGSSEKFSRSRRALAQPRFLLAAMALTLSGVVYLATAQTGRAPVKMTSSATAKKSGAYSLNDLPAMVEAYGRSRQAKAASPATNGFGIAAIGTGQSGYNLVETDLTPNTPSDEREPAYSPNGDFIAFMSNGIDANGDGRIEAINKENRYHIWVMRRDGTRLRQITGINFDGINDKSIAQSHPAWSPDGNQLVYVNNPGVNSQLFVINFSSDGTNFAGEQRTFQTGEKRTPVWSPNGLSIAFSSKANLDNDPNAANNQFDIFSISPTGDTRTLLRLTGGAADPIGNKTQDLNPTYAIVNGDAMYFSSDRDQTGKLSAGRRIWRMSSIGDNKVPVTDPTKRAAGTASDNDDYPTVSLDDTITEQLAFHSNSRITSSDTTQDYNIWSLSPLSSVAVGPNFVETEPRVFASDYTGGRLPSLNPLTNTPSLSPIRAISGLDQPEGVVVKGQYVYVANRGGSQIYRYDQETGAEVPSGVAGVDHFTNFGSVPSPSGMINDDKYLYVAAGSSGGTTKNTKAIYRFNISDGTSAGTNTTSAAFSFGEDSEGAITDGTEGLAFSDDLDKTYIFASIVSDKKVNVYLRSTGQFILTIVKKQFPGIPTPGNPNPLPTPNPDAPTFPTGLFFGPDMNGDNYRDLYVNSSGNDDVKVYNGPNPFNLTGKVGVNKDEDAGDFIKDIVADDNGTETNLNAPEGIFIKDIPGTNDSYLYVSSFSKQGATSPLPGSGQHINRYRVTKNKAGVATPAPRPNLPFEPGIANDAIYLRFEGAQGIGYFAFNSLAEQSLATETLPTTTPTSAPPPSALEGDGSQADIKAGKPQARVVTSIISSPDNYNSSLIAKSVQSGKTDNVGEDKANDLEPNFSRATATSVLASRVVFSSTRRYAQVPASNIPVNGVTPAPSNPYGATSYTSQGTADIWGTSAQDTTPPILIPQSLGNQSYPVVAPNADSPFNAPRTYEDGLRASTASTPGYLQLAIVLSDQESGIDVSKGSTAVKATFRLAGAEKFGQRVSSVNLKPKKFKTSPEQRPDPLIGFEDLPLQPYDDGPLSAGGHERQAGAVAGDGLYYCYAKLKTPITQGDFFIDINVTDQVGNQFLYDNIYGFSTKPFVVGSGTDLFVSDYTSGQVFPLTLNAQGIGDARFVNMDPVESYWLSNPPGVEGTVDDKGVFTPGGLQSRPETFENVDTWRILCRGSIPTPILDRYRPSSTTQIDPNETNPGEDGPYTAKTRNLVVSNRSIIWASPYAGTVFAAPGTIIDATTQANLTAFLESGGRLFLSGRDIARALSNAGQPGVNNNFLQNEMAADFSGEVSTNQITHIAPGDFISNRNGEFPQVLGETALHTGFEDLQIPLQTDSSQDGDWSDASTNQTPTGREGTMMDTFTSRSGSGIKTITSYKVGGATVGQRIEKTRASGLISRAVFFSFGLEAVNRRYKNGAALNTRNIIARNILQYFKTGSITGTVTNDKTNRPIANFLVLVTSRVDTSNIYLVRTEADGTFTLNGLPPGLYQAEPALLANGKLDLSRAKTSVTSPSGFFGGAKTTANNTEVIGAQVTSGFDLRPQPFEPGSLTGAIVTSQGTPSNFTDDKGGPAAKRFNVPVLVRSLEESSSVPGGGRFAQIVRTNASGRFTFVDVPSQIDLEVIINPDVEDIPEESNLRRGYINDGGPRIELGRRVLPDNRHQEKVVAPIGDTYFLNDPDPVKYPNPDTGPAAGTADADKQTESGVPIVVPEGGSVYGIVKLKGVNFAGANVELLDSNGNPLTPARATTTTADGSYNFNDVVVGTYVVRATVTVSGVTLAPQTKTVTQQARVAFGPVNKVRADFSFFIANVTGQVKLNGTGVAKALVKLYYPNGNVFRPERKATTGADGKYVLNYVPAGTYLIRASLGSASDTATFTVSATQNTTAPTLNLISRSVTGKVQSRVNNGSATPVVGITVDLLNTDGTSVAQATTDSQGNYQFSGVAAGTYKVRATNQGQTLTSQSFTVADTATSTSVPTLTFYLQTLAVTVVDPTGAPQPNASVSLQANGVEGQSGLADNNGKITFSNVPAGSYTVVATFNNSAGEAPVTVKAGVAASVTVKLAQNTSGATTFAGRGKIFYISIPYEDTNGPNSNNGANRTSPATTSIQAAFTVPPFDPKTGQQNYLLQRYDALTNQMVTLNNNSSIERGVGYILQVVNKGTDLVLPSDDPTRVALRDQRFDKTYTVTLRLNPSARGSSVNGRNLIGFGFDPQRFSSVDWATANVTHPNGQTVGSIAEAAQKGWLVNQITTSRYQGDTLQTVAVDKLEPYVGYYVQTNVDGLKITFENPTP